MNGHKKTNAIALREKMQAFALYLEAGLSAVEKRYPQHKKFVEENKLRPYRAIKEQLLGSVVHH